MNNSSTTANSPSIYGGACIITCICVGAGMLGLPTAGAGAWTSWSIVVLAISMSLMTLSGCLLLEVYSKFPYKVSFSTVTRTLLGKKVNIINNIAVYFVGSILLYAYITSAGLVFGDLLSINSKAASVMYVLMFSFFVWHSTRWVDRISVLLVIFMALSFVFGVFGLAKNIDFDILWDVGHSSKNNYTLYVASMLPVALASFGFHHSVSSLRDYYRCENKAARALLGGTIISLMVYVLWLIAIYGNLPRNEFAPVIASKGSVDVLLNQLGTAIEVSFVTKVIHAFSMAAILSSFIGVGLGVFDFLADFFKFQDTRAGRTRSWAVTFLPPLICSILFPFGFLTAIGYAAFAAAIWACIIPVLLAVKLRFHPTPELDELRHDNSNQLDFRVKGGNGVLVVCFAFGLSVMVVHIFNVMEQLPSFNGLN
ncbi:transposase [Vibrio azureus]|uniref:Aromatic amino acid permease n=1 Tax=Vibrio azureus NBRC 104587 TaxID=1219077 RepID=U3AVR0_9VIBR|nr:aromatic amino acid transporter [Vibrio azureus]AUI88241.1 transposase [Vibrio azureus]GAD77815.1 tryptophan transporter [Vibrio azureus NBRC 104587]